MLKIAWPAFGWTRGGGRYNVETALIFEMDSLDRRLAGAIKSHVDAEIRWKDTEAASTILELIRRDVALA